MRRATRNDVAVLAWNSQWAQLLPVGGPAALLHLPQRSAGLSHSLSRLLPG
jgi:hypothetical protein